MRIVTLLVRHGTTKYANAIEDCDALFARQLAAVERDLVVIDNALPIHHEEQLGPGRTLIGGCNVHWEFSAWESGLAFLGDRIFDYHLVHLVTSAFRVPPCRYLDRIDANMLKLVLDQPVALGHIEYHNEPVGLFGHSLQAYIRSSFIFLTPEELRLLGSLVSVNDRASLFSGDPAAPFRANAPLSANCQKSIIGWLTGSGDGQGVEWHSRFSLKFETLPFFEAKTAAILNEYMLSVRLRAQGCALVDVTWLATCRARLPAGQPMHTIPGWRWQITARDTDAAPQNIRRGQVTIRERTPTL